MTEQSANIELVPEFPEIISPHNRCKLCLLASEHPNLVHVIHDLVRRGMTGRPLHTRVAPLFSEIGVNVPSVQAMTRHLENHVDETRISSSWAREEGVNLTEVEIGDNLPEIDHCEVDYLELRRLYSELRPILRETRASIMTKRKKDGEPISGYDVVMLIKLFGEARQILKSLSDMRNSDRLTKVILIRHTEQLVAAITQFVGAALRNTRDRLTRGEDPEEIADDLSRLIEGEMDPMFESAAKKALEQSSSQYRLA
jgi:hypothetical protein